jgi:multidrug efflux pump subunit AcrA (membrane-fusion protein)
MDMQKYLGAEVAGKLLADTNDAADGAHDVSETDSNKVASLINEPNLGGDASQKLKELNDAILLANANFAQANGRLVWTKKLNDANYASKSDVEEDELKVQSYKIQKEKAVMELNLFRMYGFSKQAETLVSDYAEAQRKLERTKASARSKLGQAIAKLQSNKATYLLQEERWEKLKKQFAACKIKAPAPGQVVYASSIGSSWERQNNPIKLGAEVRERQKIISIPDTNAMKVEVKIHETWIDKIKEGQQANITFTAFPDKKFTGEVLKRSPLADQDNWFNPDLKVYATDVSIEGSFGFLKTGMTAKVEIIIDELEDVISVPIQAVVNREGKKLCYIERGLDPSPREVETGAFNDSFVEIKSGLSEGDAVLLNPPRIKEAATPGPKPGKKIDKKLD